MPQFIAAARRNLERFSASDFTPELLGREVGGGEPFEIAANRRDELRHAPSVRAPGAAYFCAMASTLSSILTSSPTTTPPVSSAWFHSSPKSLRLILVCAS